MKHLTGGAAAVLATQDGIFGMHFSLNRYEMRPLIGKSFDCEKWHCDLQRGKEGASLFSFSVPSSFLATNARRTTARRPASEDPVNRDAFFSSGS